jgi:ParB-like chromosome segregation protein Spo0J
VIVTNVHVVNIRPSEWMATHILNPDLRLLAQSIADHGWLYPILVRSEDSSIIDGFARWWIAGNDKQVMSRERGVIPVQWIDCDETTAKIMHVRLNRARGALTARYLSKLVQNLIETSGLDDLTLRQTLGMTPDEFDVLSDIGLIKTRKLSEHTYSPAWVPIEVPAESTVSMPPLNIERPPTPDR